LVLLTVVTLMVVMMAMTIAPVFAAASRIAVSIHPAPSFTS
jgi:hypothetical protein